MCRWGITGRKGSARWHERRIVRGCVNRLSAELVAPTKWRDLRQDAALGEGLQSTDLDSSLCLRCFLACFHTNYRPDFSIWKTRRKKKGYRDLVRELGGLERKKDGRCDHDSLMRAVDWQSLFLSSQLAREMTTLLLVWQGADRLDCTYGQWGS